MIFDRNRKEDTFIIVMGGHKKFNGTFCQNTNAVSNKQAHIKHSSIEIDDTESDKICLSAPSAHKDCPVDWIVHFPEICQHWVAASPVSLISLIAACFPIVSQCQ